MRTVYAIVFATSFAALVAQHLTSPSSGRPVSPDPDPAAGRPVPRTPGLHCRAVCALWRAMPFGAEEVGQGSFNFPRGANFGRRMGLCG